MNQQIGELLNSQKFQSAILIVLLILVLFLAIKAGFTLWLMSSLTMSKKSSEILVNGRGEPDFWEIGSELAAYRRSTPVYAEHLDPRSPVSIAEDAKLRDYLYQ